MRHPPIAELRVELQETGTWRLLRLSSGVLLPRLQRVLLTALGWFKADGWRFEAAHLCYGMPNETAECADAATVRLRHILPDTGTEATFVVTLDRVEYRHRLTVDRLLTPNVALRDAVCLSGAGTVPARHARALGFDVRVTNVELARLR